MSEAADSWASPELQAALNARDDGRLAELTVAGHVSLLLAVSNGPQMRSYSTREFMAALAIAQQFGRPSTSTDQAWIETLFGYVKGEWPPLEKIRDPGELELELDRVRAEYNAVRCTRRSDMWRPTTNTRAAVRRSAKPAATDWNGPAKTASTTVEHNDRPCHENKIATAQEYSQTVAAIHPERPAGIEPCDVADPGNPADRAERGQRLRDAGRRLLRCDHASRRHLPKCRTDNGAVQSMDLDPDDLTRDTNHLSVAVQAKAAGASSALYPPY